MHLVQLTDVQRQFILFVPKETVQSPDGVPLVVAYHGFGDSPFYINQVAALSVWLERYGWLGMLPFGRNAQKTNGLGGVRACCPPDCDEDCCVNGLKRKAVNDADETACRWQLNEDDDLDFTEALLRWAGRHTCADSSKVFATGFSQGGAFTNLLGCMKANLFRAVAPLSGDWTDSVLYCKPSKPISYVSICGTADDVATCQLTFENTAKHWSELMNCSGAGENGSPVEVRMSVTSTCTQWDTCAGGNFVEFCKTEGLAHDLSGHLRPDGTSYVRPGSDLDFSAYMFQKFSLLAGNSILQYMHPTMEELLSAYKNNRWQPSTRQDHMYLRRGRLLGHDMIHLSGTHHPHT